MEANLKKLGDLLQDYLIIPPHQRRYEWVELNWRRLWNTLYDSYAESTEANASGSSASDVFMGAMVQVKMREDAPRPSLHEDNWSGGQSQVIDGQQRLISLLVLIAAMRDFYYQRESIPYFQISSEFLNFEYQDTNLGSERLLVQEVDRSAFHRVLKSKETIEDIRELERSDSRICQAYLFYLRAFNTPIDEQLIFVSEDFQPTPEDESDEEAYETESFETQESNPAPSGPYQSLPLLPESPIRDWRPVGLINPREFWNVLKDRLRFALVELQPQDDSMVFDIFETLNEFGLELSTVDKFRNGYFMLSPDDGEFAFDEFWKPLEQVHSVGTGRDQRLLSLKDFFHSEAIRRYGWVSERQTYQRLIGDMKAQVRAATERTSASRRPRLRREAVKVQLERIAAADLAYRRYRGWIQPSEVQTPERVEQALWFLRTFDAIPILPVVMEVLMQAEGTLQETSTQTAVGKSLRYLDGLVARRLLSGIPAQQLRSGSARLSRQLREGMGLEAEEGAEDRLSRMPDVLIQLLRNMGSGRYPSDGDLLAAIDEPHYKIAGKKVQIGLVLWGIETSLSPAQGSQTPRFGTQGDAISTEHILPQGVRAGEAGARGPAPVDLGSMDSDWKTYWEGLGISDPESQWLTWRHSVGNLTLLRRMDNSWAGTQPFNEKKSIYTDRSPYKITEAITSCADWTPETIKSRAEDLMRAAILKWPY